MSHKKAKRTRKARLSQSGKPPSEFESRTFKDVIAAAEEGRETCGRLPGFVRFIQHLGEETLRGAANDFNLLFLIAVHGMSILVGDPDKNYGFPKDILDESAVAHMRRVLIGEHFRRIGLWKVRYPKDPLKENVTVRLTDHPFTRALAMLDGFVRQEVVERVLDSGNLLPILGHLKASLIPEEQGRMMDDIEGIHEQWNAYYDPFAPKSHCRKSPFSKELRTECLEGFKEARAMVAKMRNAGVALPARTAFQKGVYAVHRNFRRQVGINENILADAFRRQIARAELVMDLSSGPVQ